jgi:hypothetical protein
MALIRTLLITPQDIQDWAGLSQYLEVKYIQPVIYAMQYQRVRPLICEALYLQLIDAIQNNSLTPIQSELLYGNGLGFEGIRAYLVWECYKDWLFRGQQTSTQTGMRTHETQYDEPIENSTQTALIRNAHDQKEFYKTELVNFLEKNKASFPLYDCQNCQQKNAKPILGVIGDAKTAQNFDRYSRK